MLYQADGKDKKGKKDKKDKKEKKDKKDKKDKKKGNDDGEAPDGWKAAPSIFVDTLKVFERKFETNLKKI